MKQNRQHHRLWKWSALIPVIGMLMPALSFAGSEQDGHFVLGAPGVLITSLTVDSGRDCYKLGDTLTISGHGFGASVGSRTVGYAAHGPLQIVSWSDTKIQFRIPDGSDPTTFIQGGTTLMILNGGAARSGVPTALYGRGPAYCGAE